MKSGSTNEHRGSILLKPEENEQVFALIGNRCQCLAAGVIQLYVTEPPLHHEWIKKSTGVITLIRDNPRRSFFLRLYCLQRKAMIWEHEVYNCMEYKSPLHFFHTFEGEEYMTAFNFASETDAVILKNILLEKLNARRYRDKRKSQTETTCESITLPRKSQSSISSIGMIPGSTGSLLNGSPSSLGLNKSVSSSFMSKSKKEKKKQKDTKLTKDQIGFPSDFRHVTHMGWNPHNKGLELDSMDLTLKKAFDDAGISENVMKSRKTREFIYDVLDQFENKKMQEIGTTSSDRIPSMDTPCSLLPPKPNSEVPPPIPVRTIPVSTNSSSNTYQTRSAPPLPPLHSQSTISATPTLPSVHRILPTRPPPPVNPPVTALPPPPAPPPLPPAVSPREQSLSSATTTTLPPPPPPLPDLPNNTKREVKSESEGQFYDSQSMLTESIKSGTSLRKISKNETKPNPIGDSRSDLLHQIRQGIELKPVISESKPAPAPGPIAQDGLAGALLRALAERSRAIHSDSDDSTSDTTDDDDDEWDD